MLRCVVLCYVVDYVVMLCCDMLRYDVLCDAALQCAVVRRVALFCYGLYCFVSCCFVICFVVFYCVRIVVL